MRDDGTEEASDADLLGRVAAGDRTAFRALHARYQGPVHGFASRILGAPDRSDEVANDVMLAVWRGAARFEGRSKPSTWIFGIAYRIALKARRRRGREVVAEAMAEPVDETTPAPDTALFHGQVRGALAELPIELRAVMVLTYYYGRSVTEVAELIGVPPGTVKSRMHTARRRLRGRLG
jgi:RNA polymerase sigma-70 factor (ECF subfamily)